MDAECETPNAKLLILCDPVKCVGQWWMTTVWLAGNPNSPKPCLAYVPLCVYLCAVVSPLLTLQLPHRGCQHRQIPPQDTCSHALLLPLRLALMQQSSAHHFQQKARNYKNTSFHSSLRRIRAPTGTSKFTNGCWKLCVRREIKESQMELVRRTKKTKNKTLLCNKLLQIIAICASRSKVMAGTAGHMQSASLTLGLIKSASLLE